MAESTLFFLRRMTRDFHLISSTKGIKMIANFASKLLQPSPRFIVPDSKETTSSPEYTIHSHLTLMTQRMTGPVVDTP